MTVDSVPGARQRILASAYELFTRRGIRGVGVDEVVQRAGATKTALYRHFRSKEGLVLAFLEERERLWSVAVLESQSRERAADPEEQLLAIFDVLDDWFQCKRDNETRSFIRVLLEMGAEGPIGQACVAHLENFRRTVSDRAAEAGLRDPMEFSGDFEILLRGSVVAAAEGDVDAARRAKVMAADLVDQYRQNT